ncbi:MAG: glutamine-synthetase adenylyltransferase [Acidobacteria bacterium]|nr:glutamine-synthetase adenylyltransferase [Acidobacteriota bacterium]
MSVPDPLTALTYVSRLRERQPAAFQRMAESRTALQYAITIFSYSRFLSDELVENPKWILDLMSRNDLQRVCRTDEYLERLRFLLSVQGAQPAPDARTLSQFRRESILRILLRDVLGLGSLSEITEELSNLADAILEAAYQGIRAELVRRYGRPMMTFGEDSVESGFAIIALGKLGGGELNYSSDIDLMYVYAGNGQTEGPQRISNKEFFKKLAAQLTQSLSTYTPEGLCYRVDLRLRPEGRYGEICISLDGARNYYQKRARDWELQMLIKARLAAGDVETGRGLLEFVEPLIYSSTLDFSAVEQMSATRDRIDHKLSGRGRAPAAFDVKLARGGIRDIEFLVQCLQRLHGGRVEWIRHGGTLLSLIRLQDKSLLSATEYWRLASAYEFLRHLEHRLQVAEDRQTHVLPQDPESLDLLARQMPAALMGERGARDQLLRQLNVHLEQVITIYERIIHAQKPIYYTNTVDVANSIADPEPLVEAPGNLIRSLDDTSPALAAEISNVSLARGLRAFEHFLERATAAPELVRTLETDSTLSRHLLDMFEHSPYFAEEFIREPDLIVEAQEVVSRKLPFPDYTASAHRILEPAGLRRFFRREMVRIQTDSICAKAAIFDTLGRTSDLADAVIAAAYRMAVKHVAGAKPPAEAGYQPSDQLMVIAMGRLGMREFDLASDADLVFVLPDDDQREMQFWTRVAERTIELLSAYTGEGTLFAVDTRLRPNGREGDLVQTVGAYKEYYSRVAEAWEGMACMKSRAVVGNMEAATEFLHQLQEVDWRRYGQSGRSRTDLRHMRLRLEKEQGLGNPLKAGRGGYYDIDFALMYLRLKGAGLFFKVLNTPERIDILEKMGHLEREDAAFLEDAATFYRALDHALRVFSGHAEGSLPNSESKLAALDELVERWIPGRLHDETLSVKVAQIRQKTRQVFDRLFG